MTDQSIMRVLHVCYTYEPDAMGGTEFYVQALARELQAFGVFSALAAPSPVSDSYTRGGLDVYRFVTTCDGSAAAEGVPDAVASLDFEKILRHVDPDIVHLHARTSAVSELLIDVAKRAGKRVVLTYHSPTVSCIRGTMLLNGSAPCDGLMKVKRCTSCNLHHHGVGVLSPLLSLLPFRLGAWLKRNGLSKGPWLALRMSQIVSEQIATTQNFLRKADLVIAPCNWVSQLLQLNAFPAERLRLCRQGLVHTAALANAQKAVRAGSSQSGSSNLLRLGCFARLDPTKGIDFLIRVIHAIPDAAIELSIYGISQLDSRLGHEALTHLAGGDPRVRFFPALPAAEVLATMSTLDLVVVPSIWLETGPLVVLEAFAAGVPVLGSDRGGIAELVRSGVDGQLLPTGDLNAWSEALSSLAADHEPVHRWKQGVRYPRTMATVAEEMAHHYTSLLHA